MVSIRETERILREHWDSDISRETIKNVKNIFDYVLYLLAFEIIQEHHRANNKRINYKLKPKKRLTVEILNDILVERFINQIKDSTNNTGGYYLTDKQLPYRDAIEVV